MLSSVHPVTAMDPARTVPSPAGVSKLPNGTEAAAVLETVVNVTLIGPTVLDAPVNVIVIAPVADPAAAIVASKATAMVKAADPEPDAGATVSHGRFDVAVHVIVPGPAWVRRTCCGAVCV